MIETTLTLSIAVGITIAAAVISVVVLAAEKISDWRNERRSEKIRKENEKSKMVKRFQYLAGITDSYEDDDGTLKSRFNRIRSTAYNSDYNYRFNLRNM